MAASLVKHADLRAMDLTVRGAFLDVYNGSKYTPRWPLYASLQKSSSKKNIYPSVIDAAAIREWIEGERVINGIVLEGATVTNQTWELTYAIRRADIDDDLSGTVAMAVSRIKSGAMKYVKHYDKLATGVITGNGTALDGVALFHATLHLTNPADPSSAAYANTASGALTPDNAASCRGAMLELKTADGEPANDGDQVVLMVPPALELKARKIAQADQVIFSATATDTAEANVYKGMYTVVVNPRLAAAFSGGSDSYWYMFDTSDPEDRAVIVQEREQVEIVAQFNPNDPMAFTQDRYVWGSRARYTAAAGNPKKAQRRTG